MQHKAGVLVSIMTSSHSTVIVTHIEATVGYLHPLVDFCLDSLTNNIFQRCTCRKVSPRSLAAEHCTHADITVGLCEPVSSK